MSTASPKPRERTLSNQLVFNIRSLLFRAQDHATSDRLFQDATVLPMFLRLVEKTKLDQRMAFYDEFLEWIQDHYYNLKCCSENSVSDIILSQLLAAKSPDIYRRLYTILSLLWSYSISLQDIRALFRFLDRPWIEAERPIHDILELLENICDLQMPRSFFDMNGSTSGLILKPIQRFPDTGYTFVSWLRFPTLPLSSSVDSNSTQVLYSLSAIDGRRVKGVYNPTTGYVGVLTSTGDKPMSSIEPLFFDHKLPMDSWIHLAIHHKYNRFRSSEVTLYVNGDLVKRAMLKYPKTDLDFQAGKVASSIGCDTEDMSQPDEPVLLMSNRFRGQISIVMLIADEIQPSSIRSMFAAGPNGALAYLNKEPLTGESRTEGRALDKAIFCHIPQAVTSNGQLLSLQTESRNTLADASSRLLPGTATHIRFLLSDSMQAFGSVPVILPLFKSLGSLCTRDYTGTAPTLNQLLLVLHQLLNCGSSHHLDSLHAESGFVIMGHILGSLTPTMYPEVITTLKLIEQDIKGIEPLLVQFYRHVLFNITIWRFSTQTVLVEWIEHLCSRVHSYVKIFKDSFGTSFIHDLLARYFSAKRRDNCTVYKEGDPNALLPADYRKIRSKLISALKEMLTTSSNLDEFEKLLYHTENHDSDDALDYLQLIWELMSLNTFGICDFFEDLGGPSTLYAMLNDCNDEVMHQALRCLTLHLRHLSVLRKGKLVDIQPFYMLVDTIRAKTFDLRLYTSILGLALEELPAITSCSFEWKDTESVPTFKHRMLVRYLFEKLAVAEPSLVLTSLGHFRLLFSMNENIVQFMSMNGWETLLFNLLRFLTLLENKTGLAIFEQTMLVILGLIQYRLNEKDGWAALIELETNARIYCYSKDGDSFDDFVFLKELYYRLAEYFKAEEPRFIKGDSISFLGENFAYFLCLMEDFLFYNTSAVEPQRLAAAKESPEIIAKSFLHQFAPFPDLPQFSVVMRRRSDTFFSDRDMVFPLKGLLGMLLDVFDQVGPKLLALTNNGGSFRHNEGFKVKEGGLSRIFTRLVLFCINEAKIKLEEEKEKLRLSEKPISPSNRSTIAIQLDLPDTKAEASSISSRKLKPLVANDHFWATQISRLRILLEPLLSSTSDNTILVQAILFQLDQAMTALTVDSSSAGKTEIANLMKYIMFKRKSLLVTTLGSAPMSLFHEDNQIVLDPSTPIASFLGNHFLPDWHDRFREVTQHSFLEMEKVEYSLSAEVCQTKTWHCDKVKEKRKAVLEKRRRLEDQELQTRAKYFNMRQQSREREHLRYLQQVNTQKHLHEKGTDGYERAARFMRSELGPWMPLWSEQRSYWKMDYNETNLRMKFRMKKTGEPSFQDLIESHKSLPTARYEELQAIPEDLHEALSKLQIVPQQQQDDEELESVFEDEEIVVSDPKLTRKASLGSIKRLTPFSRVDLSVPCHLIRQIGEAKGRLDVGYEYLVFTPMATDDSKERKWLVADLVAIHQRRYVLRHTALEFFLRNGRNYMINFESRKASLDVMKRLISMHPPHLHEYHTRSPSHLLKKMQWTEKWQRREISNFEYLMKLNTIAGRTYNDLSQYPVFPWILTNFSSSSLDVNDASNYRDLSKPIGALEPKRLATFRERYRMMEFEDEQMKYMYHAHYSTAFSVFHYLIRLEPYTSQFIHYQGGRLDQPDRMFHSIPQSWSNRLQSSSDLFELIPEFYYLPDFLRNVNGYNLGVRQSGETLDSVILPPWAETAEDFIRIHREALESEYVSAHLHEWIDLIFGYKQRGEEALKADNLFHYLTYEGSIDIDAIEDAVLRHSIETQIAHFGQTPTQLFRQPHPSRNQAVASLPLPLKWGEKALTCLQTIQVTSDKVPLIHARIFADRITSLASDFRMYHHTWSLSQSAQSPSPIFTCQQNIEPIILDSGSIVDTSTWHSIFALTSCGLQVFTAGHWDRSLKVYSTESGKIHQSLQQHVAPITAVDLCETNENTIYVVTGSVDCTAIVWRGAADKSFAIPGTASKKRYTLERKGKILYGHDSPVSTVAISTPLDCVATASRSVIILYSLYKSQYIRKIPIESETPLKNIGNIMTLRLLHHTGHILSYYAGDSCYYLHSVNGRLLAKERATEDPVCCLVLKEGKLLASAGRESRIVIRNTHNLQETLEIKCDANAIRSLSAPRSVDLLFSCHDDGTFRAYALPSEEPKVSLRPRLKHRDSSNSLWGSTDSSNSTSSPSSFGILSSIVGTLRSPLSLSPTYARSLSIGQAETSETHQNDLDEEIQTHTE
eukprot:TRINITY_DN1484_c0_g1_i11.p1 TRINITY_DN1484_c0_g1~~TRINITY_DN1484_c0_g1_i11.p1  ORF type:complete len:2256 (+),score=358.56 TRINITY_DN1484_c0_g1_i11:43-6810(+)